MTVTATRKPSPPQLALLLEVMNWGMIAAPARRIFGPHGIKVTGATIDAVRRHGWLRSVDVNERRYWTVTRAGYAAAHAADPVGVEVFARRGADRLAFATAQPGRLDHIHALALAEQDHQRDLTRASGQAA